MDPVVNVFSIHARSCESKAMFGQERNDIVHQGIDFHSDYLVPLGAAALCIPCIGLTHLLKWWVAKYIYKQHLSQSSHLS